MSEKLPLISVIVPVYNVGEFLSPCLDSIKAQTYQNLEILLIDDGSTDGSEKVCDAYAETDSRFKAIHKENGGVSSARNLGLDIAKGEYIAFVDSDDRVLPDYFEVLYRNLVEHSVDASFCNLFFIDESGALLPRKVTRFYAPKHIDDFETLLSFIPSFSSACGGLFSAASLQGLQFPNMRYGEDSLFMFNWLCANPAVFGDSYYGYLYLQRQSSVTHTNTVSAIEKYIEPLRMRAYEYLNMPLKTPKVQKVFLVLYAKAFHNITYSCALSKDRHPIQEELKEHINNIFPKINLLSGKLRLFIFLYAKAPWLYAFLVRIRAKLRG